MLKLIPGFTVQFYTYQLTQGETMLFGLIKLVILILDIVAIYDCLKSPVSISKKLLWIIVILLLPFVGMILYFWIGKGDKIWT